MVKRYVDEVSAPKCFIDKLDIILQTLIPVVESGALEVWLFGSMARNQANALSDIDLLVVGDWETPQARRAVSREVEETDLREDVGFIPVDIIVRTRRFLESDDYFSRLVQRDKKVLWRCGDV